MASVRLLYRRRRLLSLIEAQKHFFQIGFMRDDIAGIMFRRNLNDSCEITPDRQAYACTAVAGRGADYLGQALEPIRRGCGRKADLYIILFQLFQLVDLIGLDQLSLTDNADAIARMLD